MYHTFFLITLPGERRLQKKERTILRMSQQESASPLKRQSPDADDGPQTDTIPPQKRHGGTLIVPQPDGDRENRFSRWNVRLLIGPHLYVVRDAENGAGVAGDILSVTGFCKKMFPPFDATAALVKMRKATRQQRYPGLSDAAITVQWDANRERASRLGTLMHSVVEACLVHAREHGGNYSNAVEISDFDGERTVLREHLTGLFGYLAARHLRPVHIEHCMYDDTLRLAGTVDAVFEDAETKELELFDWKRRPEFTVGNPWECGLPGTPVAGMPHCHLVEASMQLNMYREIMERGGLSVRAMRIVSLHPTLPSHVVSDIPIDKQLTRALATERLRQLEQQKPRNPGAV